MFRRAPVRGFHGFAPILTDRRAGRRGDFRTDSTQILLRRFYTDFNCRVNCSMIDQVRTIPLKAELDYGLSNNPGIFPLGGGRRQKLFEPPIFKGRSQREMERRVFLAPPESGY